MFPRVSFGKCQRCGGSGADYPASQLSSADSTSNLDTTGNGVKLELYQGKWLCPMCIKEIKANAESLRHQKKADRSETFRNKAGFSKTI